MMMKASLCLCACLWLAVTAIPVIPRDVSSTTAAPVTPQDGQRTTATSVVTPRDKQATATSVVTPRDKQTTATSVVTPRDKTTATSVVTPRDKQTTATSVVTPRDKTTATSVVTPRDKQTTATSVVTPRDKTTASPLKALRDIHKSVTPVVTPRDRRTSTVIPQDTELTKHAAAAPKTATNKRRTRESTLTRKVHKVDRLPKKSKRVMKQTNDEPSFFSALAYGPVHPEFCKSLPYNPNFRLVSSLGMLLFPIAFYAVYQCCCTGDKVSACCKRFCQDDMEEEDQNPDAKVDIADH